MRWLPSSVYHLGAGEQVHDPLHEVILIPDGDVLHDAQAGYVLHLGEASLFAAKLLDDCLHSLESSGRPKLEPLGKHRQGLYHWSIERGPELLQQPQ
jgi:hypothetical protein